MVKNDCGFQCMKITMIVFYMLILICYVIVLGITGFGLYAVAQVKPSESQAHIDSEKTILIVLKVFLVIFFLVHILGLVGVYREHLVTMIIMTVLCLFGVIYPVATGAWYFVIFGVIWAFLNGFFAYLINKRERVVNIVV